MLLPETGSRAADLVLEKLMAALRDATHGHWPATFSIGAVTIDGPRTTLDRFDPTGRQAGLRRQRGWEELRPAPTSPPRRHGRYRACAQILRQRSIRPIFSSPSSVALHAKGR